MFSMGRVKQALFTVGVIIALVQIDDVRKYITGERKLFDNSWF